MESFARVSMLIYGIGIFLGGTMGYVSKKSLASLAAGIASLALMGTAYFLVQTQPKVGYGLGTATAAGLDPIQAAFKEEHGLQCGFCTPGMMLVGSALIADNPDPTDDDVRWAISGQICRCTGYMNIVKAIQAAAKAKAEASALAGA